MRLWGFVAVTAGVLSLGLWLVLTALPRWNMRVASRIAPQLSSVSARAFSISRDHQRAGWRTLAHRITQVLPQAETFTANLRASGFAGNEDRARGVLVLSAALGGVLGAVLGVARGSTVIGVIAAAVFAGVAVFAVYAIAARAAKARKRRIEQALPGLLEMLGLSMSAGESIADALARYVRSVPGELSAEIANVTRKRELGVPLPQALSESADAIQVSSYTSFVAHVIAAIEQGNPLVQILVDAADDARGAQRRMLLEAGGQKEIAMLFPLVFLILPVTVLFAVWPGLSAMRIGFGP